MNAFLKLHPIILAFYFFIVITVTMFFSNPVFFIISLFASILLYCSLFGFLVFLKKSKNFAVIIILCTIFNPLFSKSGKNVLLEFWRIKITLQSLLFGFSFGIILVCSILWFLCLSQVITNEKTLYLFGKRMPKVTLTISLSLRLIPDFFKKFSSTSQTQKALGLYTQSGLKEQIKSASSVFLSVCSDVLESSAQTSDSMRARGFGINKYAIYSKYRFYQQDFWVSSIIALLVFGFAFGNIFGDTKFYYYPTLSPISFNANNILCYFCFGLIAFLPIIIKIKEDVKWKYLTLKI